MIGKFLNMFRSRPTTSSGNATFTLTDADKIKVLANHLTSMLAQIYLEEIKHDFLGTKRLVSKDFAQAWDLQGRRVAAMKDEAEHLSAALLKAKGVQ